MTAPDPVGGVQHRIQEVLRNHQIERCSVSSPHDSRQWGSCKGCDFESKFSPIKGVNWEELRADIQAEHIAALVLEYLSSWDVLMTILDEHYPADIFPTMEDREDRDPGPRIVSLVRHLDRQAEQLGKIRYFAENWFEDYDDIPANDPRQPSEMDQGYDDAGFQILFILNGEDPEESK